MKCKTAEKHIKAISYFEKTTANLFMALLFQSILNRDYRYEDKVYLRKHIHIAPWLQRFIEEKEKNIIKDYGLNNKKSLLSQVLVTTEHTINVSLSLFEAD